MRAMWSATRVVYSVGGPAVRLPRHAPVPASASETKRVECSRDALARLARALGPRPGVSRALTVAASGQMPSSRNLTIRKYSSGKKREELRGALLATAARTARRHGHTLSRVRFPFRRYGPAALPDAIPDSFLDALPSIPADPIDFLFTHERRRNIGLTARSAAITTAEFIFSARPETATRTRARSPTRREVVPQWRSAAPSCGQARKRAAPGPANSRAVASPAYFSDVTVEIPRSRPRPIAGRTIARRILPGPAEKSRVSREPRGETWRTSGLHHPGAYRRDDDSAIERGTLESVSLPGLDPRI